MHPTEHPHHANGVGTVVRNYVPEVATSSLWGELSRLPVRGKTLSGAIYYHNFNFYESPLSSVYCPLLAATGYLFLILVLKGPRHLDLDPLCSKGHATPTPTVLCVCVCQVR